MNTHIPVMLEKMLKCLHPNSGDIIVDATFGVGGYSTAILESAPNIRLYAIDRDPLALDRAKTIHRDYPNQFTILGGCFGDMQTLLPQEIHGKIDGIVLDIGVSSPQLDEAHRGFSFRQDGPLDMRMSSEGKSAAVLVNECGEDELLYILRHYGEERFARSIVRAIIKARSETPITRTLQLATLIRKVVPLSHNKIDSATRTFQGLRIAVNDELGELERALEAAEKLLAPGGRLLVIAFHSLEDRIVKKFLKARTNDGGSGYSRHRPVGLKASGSKTFAYIHKNALKADDAEIRINPRARSARLRAATRTKTPWHIVSDPLDSGFHYQRGTAS